MSAALAPAAGTGFPTIVATVDVVLLTLLPESRELAVALLEREREPFAGLLALPGGFIHAQEDLDARDAAERMLLEKTGIRSPYLEQLGTFSGVNRDPRGWSLSVVYFALVPHEVLARQASEAVNLVSVDRLRGLPFDHAAIIEQAVERVRSKSTYSTLPAHFCGEDFTLAQLQSVYEAVIGEPLNRVTFRARMAEMDALEELEGVKRSDGGRPAQVYRLKKAFRERLSLIDRGMGRAL